MAEVVEGKTIIVTVMFAGIVVAAVPTAIASSHSLGFIGRLMAEVVEGKTIIVTVMFAGAVIAAVPNIGKPYPPPTVWWTHPGHV